MTVDPRSLPRTADGYREAWTLCEATWSATVERARRLPELMLHERVDGEYSFVETLRHLVFATDRWIGRNILAEPEPYHRLGMPPDARVGRPEEGIDLTPYGIDVFAEASLDEVLVVRADRQAQVRSVLGPVTPEGLVAPYGPYDTLGLFPPGATFTISQCLDVVIREEWLHHEYATRDLTILESC
jgi:hypothetical protein